MKVELSIKDDRELRNLIKDMIRGTVVNIAREEISFVIKDAIMRMISERVVGPAVLKVLHANTPDILDEARSAVNRLVNSHVQEATLDKIKATIDLSDDHIKKIADKLITRRLGNLSIRMK